MSFTQQTSATANSIFAVPFPEHRAKNQTHPQTVFPGSKFSLQQNLLPVISIQNKMLCTKRIRL